MKKNKYHIIYTWMLLLCFIAGQYMVYAHTHIVSTGTEKVVHQNPKTQPKQIITENCQLCDAMHHNPVVINSAVYFAPVIVNSYTYKAVEYNFVSISLILSAGRSPPMA